MDVVLALDIGTSAVKGGLIGDGRLRHMASRPHATARRHPGWAEQDPSDWWSGAVGVIAELLHADPRLSRDVSCVGVVGQTPTQVLVDGSLSPTGPAIIWQDQRAQLEALKLRDEVGDATLANWLGMGLPVDATYPPARLLWMKNHRPDELDAAAACIQPKDYIVARLTGEVRSDAWCSKGLVHVESGQADPDYLDLLGLKAQLAPECLAPWETCGVVTTEAAELTGLQPGVPVTAGWSDALAAMMATGAFADAGTGFVLTGTSDIVGVTTSQTPMDVPDLLVVPAALTAGVGVVYGPTQTGGQSLSWFTRDVLASDLAASMPQELSPVGAPLFLPYLQGERAPRWDPSARGAFIGLSAEHTTADLAFAVLEGVAFSNRHVLERASEAAAVVIDTCSMGGKPTKLPVWNQIRSNVLGRSLTISHGEELSLLGAGALARLNQGVFASLAAASRSTPTGERRRYEPNPLAHGAHDSRYSAFLDAYGALGDINRLLIADPT